MNKIINENQLIILILGGLAAGSLMAGEVEIVKTVVTLLGGFLGGLAVNTLSQRKEVN